MSKIKSWVKNHKKITVAVLTILIAFLLLNCIWAVYHHIVFGSYERVTKNDYYAGANISIKDGRVYSVSDMTYLSFGGNLSINDQENKCFLLVWLTLSDEPKIGFTVGQYNFYIDKDGNLAREEDDIAEKAYEENRDLALDLLNDYNEWTKAAENNDRTFFNGKITAD